MDYCHYRYVSVIRDKIHAKLSQHDFTCLNLKFENGLLKIIYLIISMCSHTTVDLLIGLFVCNNYMLYKKIVDFGCLSLLILYLFI